MAIKRTTIKQVAKLGPKQALTGGQVLSQGQTSCEALLKRLALLRQGQGLNPQAGGGLDTNRSPRHINRF
jgi:hypothetical protein